MALYAIRIPAVHDDIAPAIESIRRDVYETARAERWPACEIAPECQRRIADLVDDLRLLGRDELADVIARLYAAG